MKHINIKDFEITATKNNGILILNYVSFRISLFTP